MMVMAALLAENSLFTAIGKIFKPLFTLVADVLAFIYGIVPNYAIAIILLTILIMGLLTPLTIKSTKSMIAMQSLQPELQKLRAKYKGAENREQLNSEMMKMYKEQGVSPTGGCLPMFLQMPALIVLYDVIKGLSNTITKGTKYPAGYGPPGGGRCQQAVCAIPRYIPKTSTMYHHLVASHGAMYAFGINLALKPFSHHANWYDYVPYFALVAIAVALQYLQMSQMTKRNPAAAKANPQMQTMQKVMPIFFAYIYFLIPAGVVLYMIVSTGIRIGTQDTIFRYGIVQKPGEREISGGAKKPLPAGAAALTGEAGNGKSQAKKDVIEAASTEKTTNANGKATNEKSTNGQVRPGSAAAKKQASKPPAGNGSASEDQTTDSDADSGNGSKPHSRSKSKRERRDR
jgi:YidC/Oxa1 family membrane protein insertase